MNDGLNGIMDNVQKVSNCINIPLLRTSRPYLYSQMYFFTHFVNVISMKDLMKEYYLLPVFRTLTWPLLKSPSHFHPLHCNLFGLFSSTPFFLITSAPLIMPLELGHFSVLYFLLFTLSLKRFLKGHYFLTLILLTSYTSYW
jgi:hypothetical protein